MVAPTVEIHIYVYMYLLYPVVACTCVRTWWYVKPPIMVNMLPCMCIEVYV